MIDGKTLKDLKDGSYIILFTMKDGKKQNARLLEVNSFINDLMRAIARGDKEDDK